MAGALAQPRSAKVRLIGGFTLHGSDGAPAKLVGTRARGILACLILAPDGKATRERLCELFWGDRGEVQARSSLRQALSELRTTLVAAGCDALRSDRQFVWLVPGAIVSDIDELGAQAGKNAEQAVAALDLIGKAYLLEDLDLGGSYRDWRDQEAARIERTLATAIHGQLNSLAAASEWAQVIALAEAWLRRDPLDETAVALAIRAERSMGASAAAQRRYVAFSELLLRELAIAPGPLVDAEIKEPNLPVPVIEPVEQPVVTVEREPFPVPEPTKQLAAPPRLLSPIGQQSEGERRHVSLLSCSLADADILAADLDPEDWHDIVDRLQYCFRRAVEHAGGLCINGVDHELLACFGYPQAQEDAVERAVRAGLAVIDAFALDGAPAPGGPSPPSTVLGIHSGEVVVAPVALSGVGLFGEAPAVAARARAIAPPGTLVLSAESAKLAWGTVPLELLDHGAGADRNGVGALYRATAPGFGGARWSKAIERDAVPFVGRADEMQFLMARWRRVLEGQGQLVLISGEAGIGKSRLALEFCHRILADRHLLIECGGTAIQTTTPFYAVTELLAKGFDRQVDGAADDQYARLARAMGPPDPRRDEDAALIGELMGLPRSARFPLPATSAIQRRQRLMDAISEWVLNGARQLPLVILVQDLHWLDSASIELLQVLAERSIGVPLLLLCTARPEFQAPWPMRAHHLQLALGQLDDDDIRAVVTAVIDGQDLPDDMVTELVRLTDGVPLFAEGLTRHVLEGGMLGGAGSAAIPITLLSLLDARLDRLGPSKEVAKLASVLGREFSFELLEAVARISHTELKRALDELVRAEIVYMRGAPPHSHYLFKHALIHDAAYQSLLKRHRRELHARVATTIEDWFPMLAQAEPQLLARHWTEAGRRDLAIRYLQSAARNALTWGSAEVAGDLAGQVLSFLDDLPQSIERDEERLAAYVTFATAQHLTLGFYDAEYAAVLEDMKRLSLSLPTSPRRLAATWLLWRSYYIQMRFPEALECAEQMMTIAEAMGGEEGRMIALSAEGVVRFFMGQIGRSRDLLVQAVALCRNANSTVDPETIATNAAFYAHLFLGHVSAQFGEIGRSQAMLDEAGQLARAIRSIEYELMVGSYRQMSEQTLGDFETSAATNRAERARAYDHGLRHNACFSDLLHAATLVTRGEIDAAQDLAQELEEFFGADPGASGCLYQYMRSMIALATLDEADVRRRVEWLREKSRAMHTDQFGHLAERSALIIDWPHDKMRAEARARATLDRLEALEARIARLWLAHVLAGLLMEDGRSQEAVILLDVVMEPLDPDELRDAPVYQNACALYSKARRAALERRAS